MMIVMMIDMMMIDMTMRMRALMTVISLSNSGVEGSDCHSHLYYYYSHHIYTSHHNSPTTSI